MVRDSGYKDRAAFRVVVYQIMRHETGTGWIIDNNYRLDICKYTKKRIYEKHSLCLSLWKTLADTPADTSQIV